jgi:geranylgeranyl pyrophosphate synthase
MDSTQHFINWQHRVEKRLDLYLPSEQATPQYLHQALRYSVLGGGKRLRPMLVYATGMSFTCPIELLDLAACACELIHCYSLIHDDLPAMDNDMLRRGKASCHVQFGEATAILAGDALQALAFQILATEDNVPTISPNKRLKLIQILANASSSLGIVGGQLLDLTYEGQDHVNQEEIQEMYQRKTGALIEACMMMAAILADLNETACAQLRCFAQKLGIAFQIQDDILDIEMNTEQLGKQQGADTNRQKMTYVRVSNIIQAKQKVQNLIDECLKILDNMGKQHSLLSQLTDYLLHRQY